VKLATAPGERLPAFCTATGKAFMAYLPEGQVRAILKRGMRKYTEHTITSIPELLKELQRTRERGFAISEQEFEAGINAVAAPILNANEYPTAAMAIVGPAFRLPLERLMQVGKTLRETTDAIAHDIGLALQFS
jgi:IclR family acetate operon transcriptional repressor